MQVPEQSRHVLHADAFGDTDVVPTDLSPQNLQQETLRHTLEAAATDGVDVNAVTEALSAERNMAAPDEGMVVEQTVAELKTLLDAWDSRHLDDAKTLLCATSGANR